MADEQPFVGYMPSVLDRLTDAESSGSGERRGYSEEQLFAVVRRDLEELLNTRRPTFHELGVSDFTEVQKSIVGYGLPDFSSIRAISDESRRAIAKEVEDAIAAFEPRLVDVRVTVHDAGVMQEKLKEQYQQMAVYFHIDAKLRMDPSPPVSFETVLELAQGRHVVRTSEL